jgi:hypothetical protein
MEAYILTEHALMEMRRRGISKEDVEKIMTSPEQIANVREGRVVYQSRLSFGKPPGLFLVRVFVDIDRMPNEVVTAYRTSKIKKYWR